MLSWIIGLAVIILVAFLLFFLGIGLLIITGGIVVIVFFGVLLSFTFGFFEPFVTKYMPTNEDNIPQKFMTCLLEERTSTCRKEYTNWGEDREATLDTVAREVESKMGKRYPRTVKNLAVSTVNNNGHGHTQIQLVVDYEKHHDVHEQWFIENGKHGTRITGFKWEY